MSEVKSTQRGASRAEKQMNHIEAGDIVNYLIPGTEDIDELLLWPPNLFAFASYIFSLTGAYQLVVSPPRNRMWPPHEEEIQKWLTNQKIEDWLGEKARSIGFEPGEDDAQESEILLKIKEYCEYDCQASIKVWLNTPRWPKDKNNKSPWIPMVQTCGKEWKEKLTDFEYDLEDPAEERGEAESKSRKKAALEEMLRRVPMPLLACWLAFKERVIDTRMDIHDLLCNSDDCKEGDERDNIWVAVQAMLSVHAITDEACVGWGIRHIGKRSLAQKKAEELLKVHGTMATIHSDRCRVLPKRHNPNVGITLRSLSSNLAFHRSSVEVKWRESSDCPLSEKINSGGEKPVRFSMLLLPWPLRIRTEFFKQYKNVTRDKKKNLEDMSLVDLNPLTDNFFIYDPDESLEERDVMRRVLQEAQKELEVDMVVLPESAINQKEVGILEEALLSNTNPRTRAPVSAYIAGVREKPEEANFYRNAVYCKALYKAPSGNRYYFPPTCKNDGDQDYKQYKHHRWKLNKSQIVQYGLSHRLSTEINWWEAIKVDRRRVSFFNIGEKLTICPLICEDLARQDPIADLIRTVGPSLVITILMDGPQKADRWSSRYAGVLSEDPGSAVITLTSFGMVRRWSTAYREHSSVIALWNDGKGPAREIELKPDASAVLLILEIHHYNEQVADGRIETTATATVGLADVIQIYA